MVALDRQVVRINGCGELQFFHSAGRLMGAGIFVALGFFVEELAVIHDPTDRRCGISSNLDQIEAFVLSQPQGVIEGHYPELLLVFVKNPDFAGADLPVSTMQRFARVE